MANAAECKMSIMHTVYGTVTVHLTGLLDFMRHCRSRIDGKIYTMMSGGPRSSVRTFEVSDDLFDSMVKFSIAQLSGFESKSLIWCIFPVTADCGSAGGDGGGGGGGDGDGYMMAQLDGSPSENDTSCSVSLPRHLLPQQYQGAYCARVVQGIPLSWGDLTLMDSSQQIIGRLMPCAP